MKYVVKGAVCSFPASHRLTLTKKQIDARSHALVIIDEKSGLVETTGEVHFKTGEVIDLDAKASPLNSYLESVLSPADGKKPAAAALA